MLWGLYTLGFDWEANDFFYFIADVAETARTTCRSCTGSAASASCRGATLDHSPATRTRGRCGSATARTTSASTTSGARCSTRSACTRSRATTSPSRLWPILATQVEDGDRALARARPRHLGGPRRAAALHVLEGHVLGGVRPRRAAGAAARGRRARDAVAGRRRRDPRRHLRARRRRARRLHASTTTPTALDASCCCMPLVRFLPPDDARVCATVMAIADELTDRRARAALPRRGDRRRPRGEEGTFTICSFWLVCALAEIGETSRARGAVRAAARLRLPLGLYAEEIDAAHRPPPRQLPAGVHPPGAHQRRDARDPRRPAARPRAAAARHPPAGELAQ